MESKKELVILNKFKEDFLKVKQMGWIPSNRFHDTGIGKTFEDFLGVIENNKPSADYEGLIELKSTRELSQSMITLFTKSPEPNKVNSQLRERFGYSDNEHPDLKILHTTFSGDKFNTCKNKFCFSMEINRINNRIDIIIKNLETGKLEDIEAYYSFDKIKNKIENKCKFIAFISAECKKENGKEFFNFSKATLLFGLNLEKFLTFLEKGIIKYDVRIGVYRTGKNKGKTHDHGSGFRVLKADIDKVFRVTELN